MTDEPKNGEEQPLTVTLQTVTLLVTIIGGVTGFFVIDNRIADVDVRLKNAQATREELENKQKTTPILGMMATAFVDEAGTENELQFVTIELLLENLGFAPVDLGSVSVAVEEGYPNEELERLLQSTNHEGQADIPVAPAPPAPDPSASLIEPEHSRQVALIRNANWQDDASQVETVDDEANETGKVLSIDSANIGWRRAENIRTNDVEVDFELEQSQKRSLRFEYLIVKSKNPKWYRFLISARPPSGSTLWQEQTIDTIVSGGNMPQFRYVVSHRVMESKLSAQRPARSRSASAIPIKTD